MILSFFNGATSWTRQVPHGQSRQVGGFSLVLAVVEVDAHDGVGAEPFRFELQLLEGLLVMPHLFMNIEDAEHFSRSVHVVRLQKQDTRSRARLRADRYGGGLGMLGVGTERWVPAAGGSGLAVGIGVDGVVCDAGAGLAPDP
jgi:hypothetical protein